MRYPVSISGMEEHRVEIETSPWTGAARVLVDGHAAAQGAKKREYLLRRPQGTVAIVQITGVGLDLMPRVTVDGMPHPLAPPLPWYEWVLIVLPITLVFMGGGLGGLCGGLAVTLNLSLLRGSWPAWGRYLGAIAVTLAAFGLYLAAVFALRPYMPHSGPVTPTYSSPPTNSNPPMPGPPPMPQPPSMPTFPGHP